mmetsp:Transcript_9793/g.25277  ORF Transcript_9793/g.25277 Transcript_9793/m.25277 type:complete len:142 (+) Transcript_9793:137-562(+)
MAMMSPLIVTVEFCVSMTYGRRSVRFWRACLCQQQPHVVPAVVQLTQVVPLPACVGANPHLEVLQSPPRQVLDDPHAMAREFFSSTAKSLFVAAGVEPRELVFWCTLIDHTVQECNAKVWSLRLTATHEQAILDSRATVAP